MGLFEFLQQFIGNSSGSSADFSDRDMSNITRGIAGMSGANPNLYGNSGNQSGMSQLLKMMKQSGLDEDQQRVLLGSLTRRQRRPQTSSYPAQRRRGLFG